MRSRKHRDKDLVITRTVMRKYQPMTGRSDENQGSHTLKWYDMICLVTYVVSINKVLAVQPCQADNTGGEGRAMVEKRIRQDQK